MSLEVYHTSMQKETLEGKLEYYRQKLLPYAYNIIGAVEPSRDVIEELVVPFFMSDHQDIENEPAYLIRSVINKSISYKNKLQNQTVHYPGPWLPEPVITADAIYTDADRKRILNYSLLVLLEKLNAEERAVFILKTAFDYRHADIAALLDIREDYSRQLFSRAKGKIHRRKGARKRLDVQDTRLLHELADAMASADLDEIRRLLAEPVSSASDGGPHTSAARNILTGRDRVAKLLKAIATKYMLGDTSISFIRINHQQAILHKKDGVTYRVMILETSEAGIDSVYILLNPEKLKYL